MRSERPTPGREHLATALDRRNAAAFVHVGDRYDATLAYCARLAGVHGVSGFVYTPDRTVLCTSTPIDERTARSFPGDEIRRFDPHERHVGQSVAAVLDEFGAGETVLSPPSVPHDAALYVERAGYDLASTDAVATARERKSESERERIELVQDAAARGLDRAREVLTTATRADERLVRDGEALTAERLRREIDAALCAEGVAPARNTRVAPGSPPLDSAVADDAPMTPATPITISLAPQGPHGYHGCIARTYVVDGDGGWERRAHVAATNARQAALTTLSEGDDVTAATLREEIVAELGAYGFDPTPGTGDVVSPLGHGVGLDARERPALSSDRSLEPGAVLAIRSGLSDPERGHVELADLVAVTDDGYRMLSEYPLTMAHGG